MRKLLMALMAAAMVPMFSGCQYESESDVLVSVIFENRTGHSLHLDMLEYESGGPKEKGFCSLDVPAGTHASKDFWAGIWSPSNLSTCKIVFDDGKVLSYHKEHGVRYDDTSSLLHWSAYSSNFIDDQVIYTFVITEDHYARAE